MTTAAGRDNVRSMRTKSSPLVRLTTAALCSAALMGAGVSGCRDKPPVGDGATSSAPSAPAPSAAAPSARAPAGPAGSGAAELAGSQVRVELGSGASLTLPVGATKRESGASKALEAVGRSKLFQLGKPGHLLSISELTPTAQGCSARLEAEWQRMRNSKDETDSKRLDMRRVATAEDRQVGGARVLYSEAQQRGAGRVDGGRPFAVMASVMFCSANDLVVVMLACNEPELPTGTQALLEGIVASSKLER